VYVKTLQTQMRLISMGDARLLLTMASYGQRRGAGTAYGRRGRPADTYEAPHLPSQALPCTWRRPSSSILAGEGKRGGISLNSPNNQVYNNTFVGSLSPLQFYAGNRVFNNIITTTGSSRFLTWPADAGAQTLDYNIYFNPSGAPRWQKSGTTYTGFSAYQAAAGETHSL